MNITKKLEWDDYKLVTNPSKTAYLINESTTGDEQRIYDSKALEHYNRYVKQKLLNESKSKSTIKCILLAIMLIIPSALILVIFLVGEGLVK